MGLDYYVKPQFIGDLDGYLESVIGTIQKFARDLNKTVQEENIRQVHMRHTS